MATIYYTCCVFRCGVFICKCGESSWLCMAWPWCGLVMQLELMLNVPHCSDVICCYDTRSESSSGPVPNLIVLCTDLWLLLLSFWLFRVYRLRAPSWVFTQTRTLLARMWPLICRWSSRRPSVRMWSTRPISWCVATTDRLMPSANWLVRLYFEIVFVKYIRIPF